MKDLTTQVIQFSVFGIPAPGGSKTAFPNRSKKPGAKSFVMVDAAGKRNKAWREAVAKHAKIAMHKRGWELFPKGTALKMVIHFYLPRPQAHFKPDGELRPNHFAGEMRTSTPDLTKLIRSTEDAMKGICWDDDAQVVAQETLKLYTMPIAKEHRVNARDGNGHTGASITITPFENRGNLVK